MILPIVSTPGQRCHVYLLWGYELMVTASAFLHSKMLVGDQNPMSNVAEFQTSELPFTVGESDNDLLRIAPGASEASNSPFMCVSSCLYCLSLLSPLFIVASLSVLVVSWLYTSGSA